MKIFYHLALLAWLSIISFSCGKVGGECELPLHVTRSSLEVTFKDAATNRYLYASNNPLYNKDSIKIYDSLGDSLFLLKSPHGDSVTFEGYWQINFGSLFDYRTDSISFNKEICKNFIVQYSYNEKDTIRTCFKSVKTKCGSMFEVLKVYYKNQLLSTEANTTTSIITINKN